MRIYKRKPESKKKRKQALDLNKKMIKKKWKFFSFLVAFMVEIVFSSFFSWPFFLSLSWSRACVLSFFTSSWGWLNGRVVLRANLTATQDAQPNKTSIVASIIEEDVSMTSSLGGSSAAPSTESAVFAEDRSDKSQYIANHVIKVSGQGQGQSQV